MTTVCLHIGAMKSGTSYLQHILLANQSELARHGVQFPGRRWRDQVKAAEDVVGIHPKGKAATPGAWDALAEEIRGFSGQVSVVSMETLSAGDQAAACRVVESFPGQRVRVIVTARDLGRVVPSQWQETIKNGAPISFEKFLALIAAPGARSMPGARAFWGPQDLGRILRIWQPMVDPGDLVLVTVPPPGTDRDLLWHRFSVAAELPAFDADLSVGANESLGEASVELLRRLNRRAKQRDLLPDLAPALKHAVAKQILAARADQEAAVTVPETYQGWVAQTADKIVTDIEAIAPVVVGDLDELRVPQWRHPASTGRLRTLRSRLPIGTRTPPHDDEVLEAALDAILGLAQRLAKTPGHRPGK